MPFFKGVEFFKTDPLLRAEEKVYGTFGYSVGRIIPPLRLLSLIKELNIIKWK
jgi:hypothetical protein